MKATEKQKERMKLFWKGYYKKNKDKIKKKTNEYYHKNKELCLKKIADYQNQRKKTDPNYRLSKNLRRLLNQAINYYDKRGVFLVCNKYPIDFASIITFLSPFPDRKIFQIDHIKPLCSFDLTDPEQIRNAFIPENHQWLLKKDNLKKGARNE